MECDASRVIKFWKFLFVCVFYTYTVMLQSGIWKPRSSDFNTARDTPLAVWRRHCLGQRWQQIFWNGKQED